MIGNEQHHKGKVVWWDAGETVLMVTVIEDWAECYPPGVKYDYGAIGLIVQVAQGADTHVVVTQHYVRRRDLYPTAAELAAALSARARRVEMLAASLTTTVFGAWIIVSEEGPAERLFKTQQEAEACCDGGWGGRVRYALVVVEEVKP